MILKDKPILSEHLIDYYSSVNESREEEFKGFVEAPLDRAYSYYCATADDNSCMYLPIIFKKRETNFDDELYVRELIAYKKREFNRSSKNNEYYSEEDIKELFAPGINIETYTKDFPFILYIRGCDDGHYYYRFRTEEERISFFNEILTFESAEELFELERENLIRIVDN